MDAEIEILKRIYERFNARDVDGVLAVLDDGVAWANGMDGGHVHGREAVRAYWERQWGVVSPKVEPVAFRASADGAVVVEVRQTVRDLEGGPVREVSQGLSDRMVGHVFRFRDGKVASFDIRDGG